ncbi:glycosyltransferase family 2 protein [Mucilaginibacter xinganensis]|nr:glycosyltransferase family 2 protein [Mucilaginibacter xinganensis]
MDISIIIPAYNRLWSLPQTIDSCRNNKCRVEIIVIDDGSSDGTATWLARQNDLVILSQPNSGKCVAVNKAFEIAKGKYIRFLDSDDLISQGANDQQFELAEAGFADIVVSGYQLFEREGQILKVQPWADTDDFIARQLGEGDGSHYSAFLFKKDFITDITHRQEFALRDDRFFILEVALKEPKVAAHKGAALIHRVAHHDRLQISSGVKQHLQNSQHLGLYKNILNKLRTSGKLTPRRINAAINILWPLAHWIAIYDLGEAARLVNWIRALNPEFKAPEPGLLGKCYQKLGFVNTEKLLRLRRKFLLR